MTEPGASASDPKRRHDSVFLTRRLLPVLLLVTLVAYAIDAAIEQRSAAADLWWHLATGRYIVDHLTIPRRDVFSYTNEGARWVNSEWLSDAFLYLVFRLGGGTGLALVKIAITAGFVGLAVWVAWRRSLSLAISVACGIAAAMLCHPFLDIRPDLFFLLGTTAYIALIEAYRRDARPAVLLLLPLTMAIWVNLHASFVYGLGVIALFTAGEIGAVLVRRPADPVRRRRALWLALAAAAALTACVLSPEHVRALAFPLAIGAPEEAVWRTLVVEWTPPVLFGSGGFDSPLLGYYLLVVIVTTLAALFVAPRSLDVPHVVLVAVTASMAVRARRFVPVFALVAVPLVATNLAVLRDRLLRRRPWPPAIAAGALTALCLLALGYLGLRLVPEARRIATEGLFDRMIDATYFPRGGTEFLRMNSPPARLFHPYGWGGYVLFHAPGRKVFIDGRAHAVYSAGFYRENLTAEFAAPGWEDILDRHGVDLVLWPSPAEAGIRMPLLRQLFGSKAWQRIYDDGHDVVFAHVERGRAWLEAYRAFRLAYPDTAGARLFLALSYLDGGALDPAREQLGEILRRFSDGETVVREGERNMETAARTGTKPLVSFALGFLREARGDEPAARGAYRAALAGGVAEPYATYARAAVDSAARVGD